MQDNAQRYANLINLKACDREVDKSKIAYIIEVFVDEFLWISR